MASSFVLAKRGLEEEEGLKEVCIRIVALKQALLYGSYNVIIFKNS